MFLTKRDNDQVFCPEFTAFHMPSLFDELWKERGPAPRRQWVPPMDVSETETEYKVRLETPGMEKKDVKVEIENGVLTISGEKQAGDERKDEKCYRGERRYGSFARALRFTDIDPEKVVANYKDGVLEVTVKKIEAAKPKKIDIN